MYITGNIGMSTLYYLLIFCSESLFCR